MNYKKLRREYVFLLEKLNINLIKQLHYQNSPELNQIKRQGVVYVINQVETYNYKIGISTNSSERLNLFTVKLPFEIKEVAVYETERYFEKEKQLHEYFSSKRLNGSEFFCLTTEDLAIIPEIIYGVEKSEDRLLEDVLLEEAKAIFLAEGRASTSLLQRKLGIGYSRASRIVDTLEANGVVGKCEGSKPREIFTNP